MNEIEVRSCGFIVFRNSPQTDQLQFLLMKHANRWDLPKGHVDPGETQMECALRELEEETAIRSEQIRIDEEFEFSHQYEVRYARNDFRPQLKELVVYLAMLEEEVDLVLTEHLGFQWFDWQPPHSIQDKTIDPVLALVAEHWRD